MDAEPESYMHFLKDMVADRITDVIMSIFVNADAITNFYIHICGNE